MTSPLKFSIITPSYNQLEWLKLSTASVCDQEGVEFEHIIQDAGSGPELADWIRTHSSRSQLFVESDSGMYDAINRGFQKATGNILAWLNCDEQYLPGALARVADFFEKHPEVDVLFGDSVLLSEKGELLSYRRAILPSLLHTKLSHLNTLSCATFVRRSVIERGFLLKTKWKAIADAVWVADMIKAKLRMAVLPVPLAAFTLTSANLGQSSLAFKEGQYWQESTTSPWLRAFRLPVIALHRLRKFWHGAYAIRNFSTEIYMPNRGINHRVLVTSNNLSFTWSHTATKGGLGLSVWKPISKIGLAFFSQSQFDSGQFLPFSSKKHHTWPLGLRLIWPFVLAAIILYFEQQSGTAIVVAPMLSMALMLIIAFFLEPLQLLPFALVFTGTIYWSIRYMQPFDAESSTDWIRLGLRITGFFTSATLAILFSHSRNKARARQDQTINILTTMPMPVIISDPIGVILFANDEAVEFTKMDRSELIGAMYPQLFMTSQDEGTAMRDYIKYFQQAPELTGSLIPSKRTISLKSHGLDHVEASFICLGEKNSRYMVTVMKT